MSWPICPTRWGFTIALIGVSVGLIAALASSRLIRGLLFGVQPVDPPTFAVVSLVVVAVILAACYVPARRTTKVDPWWRCGISSATSISSSLIAAQQRQAEFTPQPVSHCGQLLQPHLFGVEETQPKSGVPILNEVNSIGPRAAE
jgi:hypothetical protein